MATATVSALTVAAAPAPAEPVPVVMNQGIDLAAAYRPFTDPKQIPDLTGGLGTAGYDFAQQIGDMLLRALVGHLNLPALGKSAGLDLPSLLEKIPPALLEGVLGAIPINLGGVLLDSVGSILTPVLLSALSTLGITDAGGNTTLINLLGLLGLDLSDPLNLSNLDLPGVKLITTGPPFTLLKMLGLDLGWVPGFPNSVANAINSTTYLDIGLKGLVNTLIDRLEGNVDLPLGNIIANPLGLPISLPIDLPVNVPVSDLLSALKKIVNNLPVDIDAAKVRVPIVVGFGLGAFAAGSAYQQVVDQLPYQPGGAKSPTKATDPLLGSFTVLPMFLLRNPGRANGGLFARFFPIAGLFGIDTVTPDTHVQSSGGVPILNTGLSVGGANLIPVKVDATVEYDIVSDFPAWPNPFSIANSVTGAMLPTYLLRGIDTSNVSPQLLAQVQALLAGTLNLNNPLALNLYLTLPTNSLPLLEPLYLAADLTNLMTMGAFANMNPLGMLANALAPAMTSLVNLGYTDVVRNPDGTYSRTLDEAGVPTPFMSFPDINWGQVPGDVIHSLVSGFQKEFFSGHPTPGTPNAITGLLKLLTGVLGPLGGLGDLLNGLPGLIAQQVSPVAANALPEAAAKSLTLSTTPATGNAAPPPAVPVWQPQATSAEPEEETETTTAKPTTTRSTTTSGSTSATGTVRPAGPSASPKPPSNPVGSVVGGVTNTVGGVTNGVAGTVGGVTGGVAGTVGGVTGGVAGTVGGVTGGLTGALGGLTKNLTGGSSGG
ncbi:ATPase [Mycobacterium sp. NPDC048908]|uniref:ATPase n=1 Tax=Mycobacterium sp. NPDC048908 TaxID=3364292 RepID=UPI003711C001